MLNEIEPILPILNFYGKNQLTVIAPIHTQLGPIVVNVVMFHRFLHLSMLNVVIIHSLRIVIENFLKCLFSLIEVMVGNLIIGIDSRLDGITTAANSRCSTIYPGASL